MKLRFGPGTVWMAATPALAAKASAQSFNIDFGTASHAVPSSSYGGAANQPGDWNVITDAGVPDFSGPLVDLLGQPTGVAI